MKHPLICSFLVLAVLPGCSPTEKNWESTTPSVRVRLTTFERTIGGPTAGTGGGASVKLEYPVVIEGPNSAALDSLNRFIREAALRSGSDEKVYADPEPLAEEFFGSFREVTRAFPGYQYRWFLERRISLINDATGIVTLAAEERVYEGGAHPNSVRLHIVVDTKTGRRLALNDVIRQGSRKRLVEVAERAFRSRKGIRTGDDLATEGYWFKGNLFDVTENFGLAKTGLLFYYNSYEIAPYSAGPTELLIPYEDLEEILNLPGR